ALVIGVLLLMTLIEFPFGWYARFRVQESYGYMRTPRLPWLKRALSETVAGLLYMMPVTALLLTLCAWAGPYWWLLIWILWVGYLFWRWYLTRAESIFWHRRSRPYQNEAVTQYLQAHLKRFGYEINGIVIMNRPRHWMRSNVVLAGSGRHVTVIIFAHALNELTARELLAAVLHELGHLKGFHSEFRIAFFALLGLAATSLFGLASRDPAFFIGFGFLRCC
ncbi:endopeptidase, partial [gut metagenome]